MSYILRHSLLLFLWLGSVAGILVGLGMLFKPEQIVDLNRYLSRWVGSDRLHSMLDKSRSSERFFYRHNRLVGAVVLLGSLLVLYTFLFSFNLRKISTFVPHRYWWLSDAVVGLLLVGMVLAALVGLIVLTKPSLLRDIEKSTNQWVSTEQMTSMFGKINLSAEQALFRNARLTGTLLMLSSLYVMFSLGYSLLQGKV